MDASHEERLKHCGLTALEKYRVRAELIETYKLMMTNKVGIAYERYFTKIRYSETRGHKFTLFKTSLENGKGISLVLE